MLSRLSCVSYFVVSLALIACGGSIGEDPVPGTTSDAAMVLPSDASNCASVQVDLSEQVPTVMLLVDRSGSMDADFGGQSRWDAMYDTLMHGTTGVVKDLEDRVRFGVALYTSLDGFAGTQPLEGQPAGTCPMMATVLPSVRNHAAIDAMYQPKRPLTDTPTGASLVATTALLAQVTEPGPKIIVLATDGAPDSCTIPNPGDAAGRAATQLESTDAATAAYLAGIQTYVISVGDAVGAAHLQDMANAGVGLPLGGTSNAPYYQALNPTDLIAAFDAIIGGVRSCILTLDGQVTSGDVSGQVSIDGVVLTQDTDWRLNDLSTIEILGSACQGLLAGGNHSVTASFACGALVD